MKTLRDAQWALRRLKRIMDSAQVHTSPGIDSDHRRVLKFDGMLIEPCNMMHVDEYLGIIKEYLECQGT